MIRKVLSIAIITLVVFGCSTKSDDDGGSSGNDTNDAYNRGALLTNMADNIIIPAYQDLNTKLLTLAALKNDFLGTRSQSNLEELRAAWFEAYKTWQYVEAFNIGKAEEILFSFQMNVYPTNTTDIETNITSGNYDLSHVNNNDAVGFPALDYMLYGLENNDASILSLYANTNYKNYLSDLIDQMQRLTEIVLSDWINSYRSTFISSTENTASSALNKFVNDFIFYYEKGLRANKIGIPAGVFSTGPLPDKVEGFYSKDTSKELISVSIQAVQDLFNGKSYGTETRGESLKSFLQFLDRNDLVTRINNQLDDAKQKIQLLDDSLYNQVITDNSKMTEAYDALQLAVVSFKVDMLQAFNISIDYVDADGD